MNEALRDYPDRLRRAIDGLSEEALRRPERQGKWSITEVIAHLTQFELIVAVRIRTIIGGETPSLLALDQERWVRDVYRGESAAELIDQLAALRRMNLDFLGRLGEDDWDRAGIHPQYGLNTIGQLIERFERHQEKHLRQIERIRDARG